MIRILYHHKGKERALVIPGAWEELSKKQLISLAALLHSQAPALHTQVRILKLLSGKGSLAFDRIPAEIRFKALEHLGWIESTLLTKQLLPVYKGFYGPASDFDNIVLAEYNHSEIAYYNYVKTGSMDALNELVATLYRPINPDYEKRQSLKKGDLRCSYSYSEVNYNKEKVSKWSLAVKLAILLFYDGCRQSLTRLYPAAFNGSDTSNSPEYFQGLYKMIRSLSGTKYGSFDQVEKLSLHTAFMEIVCSLEEAEELKRKMQSNI